MARDEHEREDLLGEATALVERIEVILADSDESIVIGFRDNGAVSIYFGSDPAYHFNSSGELRRAFVDGLLYKSENGQLVSMRRKRTPSEVQLLRHDLTRAEQAETIDVLKNRLTRLLAIIDNGDYKIAGQVPTDVEIIGRCEKSLDQLVDVSIAKSARVE